MWSNEDLARHVHEIHLSDLTQTFGLAFLRDLEAVPGLQCLIGLSTLQQPYFGESDVSLLFRLERLTVDSDGPSKCQPLRSFLSASLQRLDLNISAHYYDHGLAVSKFSNEELPNLVDFRITFRRYFHSGEAAAFSLLEHVGSRLQTLHLRSTSSSGDIVIGHRNIAQLCPQLRTLSCNLPGFAPVRWRTPESDSSWRELSLDLLLLGDPTSPTSVLPAQARDWAHAVEICCPRRVGFACYDDIHATDVEREQTRRAIAALRDVGWQGAAEDRFSQLIDDRDGTPRFSMHV